MYTHRPRGVCTNGEVTLGGKRSGVWNVNSGPQEQGLPVKQVPGVWSGGGRGLVSETLFFFFNYLFLLCWVFVAVHGLPLGFSL